MYYVALDRLLERTGNSIYKLVILASKRALEIAEGQPKLVEASASIKASTVALFEIFEGKIGYKKIKA
jgi:DNA-directed RNA polymerase omega subunit